MEGWLVFEEEILELGDGHIVAVDDGLEGGSEGLATF